MIPRRFLDRIDARMLLQKLAADPWSGITLDHPYLMTVPA